jgi:hypothetical protein
MTAPSPIHLVLCEGADDQRVMEGLAAHAGIADKLKFRDYAESGTLRSFLATLAKSPDFTRGEIASILVTRDADDDYETCWQSVRDAVRAAFEVDLSAPGEWQTMTTGPKVAAWINPAPGRKGMLESLFLEAAKHTHAEIFPCIENFVQCIETARGATLHEKSRFYIWSIVAQGPGPKDRLSLDRAMKHLPPDWDAEAFAGLRSMLAGAAS